MAKIYTAKKNTFETAFLSSSLNIYLLVLFGDLLVIVKLNEPISIQAASVDVSDLPERKS